MFWSRFIACHLLLVTFPVFCYQLPDQRLVTLVDTNLPTHWQSSASGDWLLELESGPYLTLAQLQEPKRGLAGITINMATLSSNNSAGLQSLRLKALASSQASWVITAEQSQRLFQPRFSPDERWLSFVVAEEDGLYLALLELATKKTTRLPQRLNAVFGIQYQWQADSAGILVTLAPKEPNYAITGLPALNPKISQSHQQSTAQRTLQLLLASKTDEDLFEQLSQSRLVKVSTDLTLTELYRGAITHFSLSPDNAYVLLQQLQRPYSQRVRYPSFPQHFAILALANPPQKPAAPASLVTVASLPLHESRQRRQGLRLLAWRPDHSASLYWTEPDPSPDYKEGVWQWSAPFNAEKTLLHQSRWRVEKILWSETDLAILYERVGEQLKAWIFTEGFTAKPILWQQWHRKDLAAAPGEPILQPSALANGGLLELDNKQHFYVKQRQPDTTAETLWCVNAQTLAKTIVWQSRSDKLEQLERLLPEQKLLISQQTANQPKTLLLRQADQETLVAKPHNPLPAWQTISAQIIHYQRADGVALSGRLLLPAGYKPEMGPLPVLLWAYPREYDSAELAEQKQPAAQQYVAFKPTTAQPFTALGYAVFDQVTMPIIADKNRLPNDDFLEQLTANAAAAITALTRLGIAELDNIAIGGHSYGAFMVANLLAHTNFFQAGIARSGAYNRTLTPFGFQSEKRHLWQEPTLYQAMSPFLYANNIQAPLLLIHGEADSNSGTFPMQSVRMFEALQGLGKTARLVLLPEEGHHYRARESLLHLLWEQQAWLKQHLRPTDAMRQLTDPLHPSLANSADLLDHVKMQPTADAK